MSSTFILVTSLGENYDPRSPSTRILIAGFWIFASVMLSMFAANLSAFLTVSGLDSGPTNIWELFNQEQVKVSLQLICIAFTLNLDQL